MTSIPRPDRISAATATPSFPALTDYSLLVTTPAGGADVTPVVGLLDRRIATIYRDITRAASSDAGLVPRRWAEIDRLLDLRIWLRSPVPACP